MLDAFHSAHTPQISAGKPCSSLHRSPFPQPACPCQQPDSTQPLLSTEIPPSPSFSLFLPRSIFSLSLLLKKGIGDDVAVGRGGHTTSSTDSQSNAGEAKGWSRRQTQQMKQKKNLKADNKDSKISRTSASFLNTEAAALCLVNQ